MTPPPRPNVDAADALIGVAPLTTRWIERLLASHDPPLTVPQYLALRAIDDEPVFGVELARRAGVSEPAVSQLIAGLAGAGLLERRPAADDRRRQTLTLSTGGQRALRSARCLLADRLAMLLEDLPVPEANALARALPHVEELLSGSAPPRRSPPRPPHRRRRG
jgi:DNA-binding MarR family transcriptional regulator